MRAAGGDAKLTVYQNQGHEIDQLTYARADFWELAFIPTARRAWK